MGLEATTPSEPLVIWAVSDGRAGIEAQAVGLAEAIARLTRARIVLKRIAYRGKWGRLPWRLHPFPRATLTPESDITGPWPDIWIGCGRASIPLSIRVKRWSRGKTFVVQLQDPKAPSRLFDLVAPPRHDRLTGDKVFPIVGSPHRVTAARLAAEHKAFARKLNRLPHPRVAVLIGGRSKAFDLSQTRAAGIARDLVLPLEHDGGSLMMTFSRRTPDEAKTLMKARLKHLPGVIWDGEGPNPYFAFLAAADYICVTEDSTNMAVEAAGTGKPVFVLKMDGESRKFRAFHQSLEDHGAARPFGGHFHGWTYEPLAETDRLAAEVLARMGGHP